MMTDSKSANPQSDSAQFNHRSGGADFHAEGDISIGGDVVGRDKFVSTTTIITDAQQYDVQGLPNPYLGLKPFTYERKDIYAGRDDEIDDAVARLTAPGEEQVLMFVTGASGSGKSSFVQAGLLPWLENWYSQRNRTIKHAVFSPAHNPMKMLEDALSQLGKGIRQVNDLASLDQVSLIVIDQFEELFTQSESGPRDEFAALLQALPAFDQIHAHFVATLRSDYLNELFDLKDLWGVAKRGIELRAMSEESLRQAILKPLQAEYPDKRMEPELLDSLAHDTAQNVAYLPLLQVTLYELWKEGRLKRADYSNLADAIKQRAETVYKFVDHAHKGPHEERPQADQDIVLEIFRDLVQVSLDDDALRATTSREDRADSRFA